ncbi:uncharacterized protein LOC133876218 [Alnus glutinosa]|uniref:uncharacterized protein LOC133876218 n=1 Tax=Alnus glutinosa TaxID=3517 RepID=UPI002D79FDBD|nr:uncharacterized protein LOC133876218 [Alnus glutinosa]
MELCKSGPIHLEIKDGTQVAVGKRGGQFTRMVSKIVRNHCELHHASWCNVPPEQKEMLRNRLTSYVTLNMNRVEEILTLNGALRRSYTRLRNKLYNKHYKPFLKDDEEEGNEEGNEQGNEQGDDEGKAKARATVPEGIAVNAWLMICGSFDEKLWKVNLINLNLQCCYRYAWNTTL